MLYHGGRYVGDYWIIPGGQTVKESDSLSRIEIRFAKNFIRTYGVPLW